MTTSPTLALRPVDVRVLGCLVEKHLTTPDVYPLTLNALVTACNQTSNRFPVTAYSAAEVTDALDALRATWRLARVLHAGAGSRTDKYRHVLDDAWQLSRPEAAVMAVLAVRGPQTLGELKTRTERLHSFDTLGEVDAVIDRLSDPNLPAEPREPALVRETGMLRVASAPEAVRATARPWPGALVVRVERGPGQKEGRIVHLLGEVDVASYDDAAGALSSVARSSAGAEVRSELELLRGEVDGLRMVVEHMRAELADLRRQLGD